MRLARNSTQLEGDLFHLDAVAADVLELEHDHAGTGEVAAERDGAVVPDRRRPPTGVAAGADPRRQAAVPVPVLIASEAVTVERGGVDGHQAVWAWTRFFCQK